MDYTKHSDTQLSALLMETKKARRDLADMQSDILQEMNRRVGLKNVTRYDYRRTVPLSKLKLLQRIVTPEVLTQILEIIERP